MVNIFKKRTHLCVITTSVLFFLQGMDVCMGSAENSSNAVESTVCAIKTGGDFFCNDGSARRIEGKTFNISKKDGRAIYVKGKSLSPVVSWVEEHPTVVHSTTMIPLPASGLTSVKKQKPFDWRMNGKSGKTYLYADGVNIVGPGFDNDTIGWSDDDEGPVSAVVADGDARILFASSSKSNSQRVDIRSGSFIRSFGVGLKAQGGGGIAMFGGAINTHYMGAVADYDSYVYLDNTRVSLEGEFAVAGLQALGGDMVVDGGAVSFSDDSVGVSVSAGGRADLKNVSITRRTPEESGGSVIRLTNRGAVFEVNGKGKIDFFNGSVIVADSRGIWIKDEDDREIPYPSIKSGGSVSVESLVNIRNSGITIEGDKSYGIDFDGWSQSFYAEEDFNSSRSAEVTKGDSRRERFVGGKMVLLNDTNFVVPDGTAIYSKDLSGSVVLRNSFLVGDLLFRSEGNSTLGIFVDSSEIRGGGRVSGNSLAKLYLSNGSLWSLVKSTSKSQQTQNQKCFDACISSVVLEDSTIQFLPTLPESASRSDINSSLYQTLRIGNGKGEVYRASGNSWIHLNAYPDVGNPAESQVSDRLLIYGNVSGKTNVYVHDILHGVRSEAVGEVDASSKVARSFSIIQVHGSVERDSFRLNGEYVTLGGKPYQYVLRLYGPTTPPRTEYFDSTLLTKSKEFWDFRLESKSVSPEVAGAYTPYVESSDPYVWHNALLKITSRLGSSPQNNNYSRLSSRDFELENGNNSDRSASVNSQQASGRVMLDPASGVTTDSQNSPVVVGSVMGNVPQLSRVNSLGEVSSTTIVSSGEDDSPYLDVDGLDHAIGEGYPLGVDYADYYEEDADVAETEDGLVDEMSSLSGRSEVSAVVSPVLPASGASIARGSIAPKKDMSVVTASRTDVTIKQRKPVARVLSVVSTDPNLLAVSSSAGTGRENPFLRCDVGSEDRLSVPYWCQDGQVHEIRERLFEVRDSNKSPVHASGGGTSVRAESVTIVGGVLPNEGGGESHLLSSFPLLPLGSAAALATQGGELILENKSSIRSALVGLEAQAGGNIKMIDGKINVRSVGAFAGSGSSIHLKNTDIVTDGSLAMAGLVSDGGTVEMHSGSISSPSGVGVRSEFGGNVMLDNVKITAKSAVVDGQQKGASRRRGKDRGRAAFFVNNGGSIDFGHGSVVTDANGIWLMGIKDAVEVSASRRARHVQNPSSSNPAHINFTANKANRANIEFSDITVEGSEAYGIYFDEAGWRRTNRRNQNRVLGSANSDSLHMSVEGENPSQSRRIAKRGYQLTQDGRSISPVGTVSLKETSFKVPDSIAIYGDNSRGNVSLERKTTLLGDLLLKAENSSDLLVFVNNSTVIGGVRIDEDSRARFELLNRAEWILKKSKKSWSSSGVECLDSCISSISLGDSSSITFESSLVDNQYQTLRIGRGDGEVYTALGNNVFITLNARLGAGESDDSQMTDRVLIHGNVSGKTIVNVNAIPLSPERISRDDKVAHSVSIIQVYGNAEKDSFQLNGGYVALAGAPYQYTLRSYGPQATSKGDHVSQKFMQDGENFWNFRLENKHVKVTKDAYTSVVSKRNSSGRGSSSSESAIRPHRIIKAVVPQVPTYLLLPNAAFHAGLMDVNNQNKQLEAMRFTSSGMLEVQENPAVFLRGYRGDYRYSSDLSAAEYGFGGDLGYNSVEAGALLTTIESDYSATSFGVMGSYGKLSLQPLDVDQSKESTFDKWSVTAYGSFQHDAGFYADGLVSYGVLKGDVLTRVRGKAATLKGRPLSVSLTGGKALSTGYENLIFDPQIQVVYQHLQFDKTRDIDNIDVELGKLDQWVVRVGGRLTKSPVEFDDARSVAFYGKLHFAHSLGKKQSVRFSDEFKLGSLGSSLEAGLGVNVKLLPKFTVHGDFLYQHKINKAGFSGATFSGGLRYQF
ncbi:autotransporter outer membrane beta-barrel domain-containing protein [Bartonella sp. B41]